MRRVFTLSIILGVAAALGVLGQAALLRATAQARVTIINEQVPAGDHEPIPDCNGNPIEFQGTLHIVTHLTRTPSGSVHLIMHENFQGVTAVDTVTGEEFRTGDAGTLSVNATPPFPFEFTSTESLVLSAPGPDNNLRVKAIVHHTLNANGELTSVVENFVIECR